MQSQRGSLRGRRRARLAGWPHLAAFARDLEILTADCRGAASLEAYSPGNFALTVWNLDALGHFAIRFQIGSRASFVPGVTYGLSGGFEVSLSEVESMLAWLRALADAGEFSVA